MNNPDLYKLGNFRVAARHARDRDDEIYLVLNNLIVTHAELMFHNDYIYYTAIGPDFENVSYGCEPIDYTYSIENNKVVWTKV